LVTAWADCWRSRNSVKIPSGRTSRRRPLSSFQVTIYLTSSPKSPARIRILIANEEFGVIVLPARQRRRCHVQSKHSSAISTGLRLKKTWRHGTIERRQSSRSACFLGTILLNHHLSELASDINTKRSSGAPGLSQAADPADQNTAGHRTFGPVHPVPRVRRMSTYRRLGWI
jgi:hypothetical protein